MLSKISSLAKSFYENIKYTLFFITTIMRWGGLLPNRIIRIVEPLIFLGNW